MRMIPSIFDDDVFHDFFAPSMAGNDAWMNNLMRTDVEEKDDSYELKIDLPGFDKKDLNISLKNGVLTVKGTHDSENEQKDKEGHFLRKERYSGTCERSYFVGKNVEPEQIHAGFNNGILTLSVPKSEVKQIPESNRIESE